MYKDAEERKESSYGAESDTKGICSRWITIPEVSAAARTGRNMELAGSYEKLLYR